MSRPKPDRTRVLDPEQAGRLIEQVWPLIESDLTLPPRARAYYEAVSRRTEGGLYEAANLSDREVAEKLKWSVNQVRYARNLFTEWLRDQLVSRCT